MHENDLPSSNTVSIASLASQYGVSDSLKSMFEGLRETPGVSGDKFTHQDIHKFAQYIVCRNYGKLCLELSYLLFCVANYSKHTEIKSTHHVHNKHHSHNNVLLNFFWLEENFTVSRFRQYFNTPYQPLDYSITLSKANLTLSWSDKSQTDFSISPTRAGVLAVLFEFIMMINPAFIAQAETALIAGDESSIKALSSTFQKALYAFLMEHLTVTQVQRRFRFITQWLTKKGYKEDFLTDECILTFWQSVNNESNVDTNVENNVSNSSNSSLSFKLYSVVFDNLIQLDQAIQQSKQAHEIANSMVIGNNLEQGEISENVLENYLFDCLEKEHDYQFLSADPKFLTQAQWHTMSPYVTYQTYQKRLALSLARLASFGTWQAILVQAKRRSPIALEEKLSELPEQTYLTFVKQLNTLNKAIDDVIMGIQYIYFMHNKTACITEFLNQLSDEQQQYEKQLIREALAEPKNTKAPNELVIFSVFQEVLAKSPNLKEQVGNAKKAFQKNNKSGFKTLPEKSDLAIYYEGETALKQCKTVLNKKISIYNALWKREAKINDDFLSDAFIFKQSFEKMYCVGESNNE